MVNKVSTRAELKRRSLGRAYNERVNDKPRLPYNEGLGNYFKDYPPRQMIEPMFYGHWHTLEDYKDLSFLEDNGN